MQEILKLCSDETAFPLFRKYRCGRYDLVDIWTLSGDESVCVLITCAIFIPREYDITAMLQLAVISLRLIPTAPRIWRHSTRL